MINSQKLSSIMLNKINFNLSYEMMLKSCAKMLVITNKIFKNKKINIMEKVNNANKINSYKAEAYSFNTDYEYNVNKNYNFSSKNYNENSKNTELPFINTTSKNGIFEEILLTNEELLVLKLAVNHNGNIVNLCNKKDTIRSLFTKGLLKLSEDGAFVVVNRLVEILIKTEKTAGCLMVGNNLSEELNNESNYSNICWGNL